MTIKEVEKKLNISRANIRFYEKEGLYELKEYKNELPNKIKEKTKINYDDDYFKNQINNYCNK